METERIRERLLIIGGGFAAFRLAMSADTRLYDVTLISPRNHFLFTPLLASTTVGTTEFRSIIEPLRQVQKRVCFYQAFCEAVDTDARAIRCRGTQYPEDVFSLSYEKLVIAVGAVSSTFGIAGAKEYTLPLKELSDARQIRQRIIASVEEANLPHISEETRKRLLHFVVVGGGPTGVEFAGELHDFLKNDLRPLFPHLAPNIRITLLEATDQILGSFDRSLGEYAKRIFTRRHIEVRTSSIVEKIEKTAVFLKDGSSMPYGVLVWSAGIGPTKLVESLPWPKDARGRLLTDGFLKVGGQADVYAIGDCAVVENKNYPQTAQLAQQEGKYLARVLRRGARGKKIKPFFYFHQGMLAYIGGHRGLADTPGIKWKGFIAWLLWRSVYITKLVSFKNKVRVLFDWFKTSLFGRDTTSF